MPRSAPSAHFDGALAIAVNESGERRARVIGVGRNAVWIAFEGRDAARLASLRKSVDRQSLAPGDLVIARELDPERALVLRREPRSFTLERRTAGGRVKTMAANVDGIAVVAALAHPPPQTTMLDELLAFGELHDIGARLVFTKPDLAGPQAPALVELYQALGYDAVVVNPKAGEGIAALYAALDGRRTLLIGQSGVGKSSIFRALGGTAEVGDLSRFGRGRQTTTSGRLHYLAAGFLIDSPGVGEFALFGYAPRELALGFVEFPPLAAHCRFNDCTHRSEPDCAVRAALGEAVAPSRYDSYRAILARTVDVAPWAQP